MTFTLPELNYSYQALEPYIDSQTMHLHHTAHHQAYINKLNEALVKTPKEGQDIISVQKEALTSPTVVRNNGGGHYNHSLFWKWMTPVGTSNVAPVGILKGKIEDRWGSVDEMKKEFNNAAATRFGSGWAWLTVNSSTGTLNILSTPNQDNPLMEVGNQEIPILGLDVWEHAYYLKYQNRRPEYIQQWWNVVNWDKVVEGYDKYASNGLPIPIDI